MVQETRSVDTVVVVEHIEAITCDLCGEREADAFQLDNFGAQNTYATLDWRAGYGSELDGRTFHVDLCATCMELLASTGSRKDRLREAVASLKASGE